VFLVVDGHPSHRAKAVAAYVASCRGDMELRFLPPYALVLPYAKMSGVAKKPLNQNESLKLRVGDDLAAIKSKPKLVRSFLHAKSATYPKG